MTTTNIATARAEAARLIRHETDTVRYTADTWAAMRRFADRAEIAASEATLWSLHDLAVVQSGRAQDAFDWECAAAMLRVAGLIAQALR